jgi:hypothetical protein
MDVFDRLAGAEAFLELVAFPQRLGFDGYARMELTGTFMGLPGLVAGSDEWNSASSAGRGPRPTGGLLSKATGARNRA